MRGTSPVGVGNPIRARIPRYDRPMWYFVYLVVRALVRLLVGGGRPDRDGGAKDLEILVLRHSYACCSGRRADRSSGPPTWAGARRRVVRSRVTAGSPSSSPRRPSSAGTASW